MAALIARARPTNARTSFTPEATCTSLIACRSLGSGITMLSVAVAASYITGNTVERSASLRGSLASVVGSISALASFSVETKRVLCTVAKCFRSATSSMALRSSKASSMRSPVRATTLSAASCCSAVMSFSATNRSSSRVFCAAAAMV